MAKTVLRLISNKLLQFFLHRKEAEPEVIYLKHVERQQQQQAKIEESVKYPAPTFMTPLNNLVVTEGEKVRFDAKIAPAGDPSMKVEWFFNGQAVSASKSISYSTTFILWALYLELEWWNICLK